MLDKEIFKYMLINNGLKYVLFSHNKKMGSAKGAVLLAEMLDFRVLTIQNTKAITIWTLLTKN